MIGQSITIGGLAQLRSTDTLSVTLVTATRHLLAEAEAQLFDFNSWQADLNVPHTVSGPVEIQAIVRDESGNIIASDTQAIQLVVNKEGTDRYLELYRPATGENAVAGHNLFFDGRVQLPVNGLITISIWNESCQVEVTRQGFRLRGSGYWQGFVVIPNNIAGPVCAVVHFGTSGEDTRREAQLTLNVLPADDPDAVGVHIGNPPPNSLLTPGKSLLFYGTAYNAPDQSVMVSILLENGRLLTEGVAAVNNYGYWELELFIPDDASGRAQIEATVGERDGDDSVQHQTTVQIGPAP